jgi:Uma2 family endonuclease
MIFMTTSSQGVLVLPDSNRPKARKMNLQRFREWRSSDGWKYDWNDGVITKYKRMVSKEQRFVVRNIQRAFHKTEAYQLGHDLMSESEMSYDDKRYRIPNLAFYTQSQTTAAAKGAHTISPFVIEILSDTDLAKNVEDKIWEYFQEGVQVVWPVLPYRQIVKVFSSPKDVKVCVIGETCDAAPVLPDFKMKVEDVFALD